MSNRRSSVDFTRIFSRTIRFEKNLSPIQFATINIDLSLFLKEKLVENGRILSGRSVVRREHDRS